MSRWKSDMIGSSADFGFWPFGSDYESMSDEEVANDILNKFVDAYNSFNDADITIEDLKLKYPSSQIIGLGTGVKFVPEITSSVVNDAMKSIVKQSRDLIPENLQVFLQALSEQVQGMNPIFNSQFWKSYGVDVVKTLAVKGQQVEQVLTAGSNVISAVGKNINWLLPIGAGVLVLGTIAYFMTVVKKK